MIIHRRRVKGTSDPTTLGIVRVTSMLVLGVTVANDLSASSHVNRILSACSRSLYALRVLRAHGFPPTALHEVARETTISRLLYASPAWWGSPLQATDINSNVSCIGPNGWATSLLNTRI